MERSTRLHKPLYEKENQQKFVNKKTDLLSSFNNIKLPLHTSQNYSYKDNQYQSVPNRHMFGILSEISLENASERDFKQPKLKKESSLTEQYCKNYGMYVEYALLKQVPKRKFLSNHKVDGILRARMLDWMVQVISSYNFQNKTYFAGIEIMDRFFASSTEMLLPSQLHIIGVQSMFIASKMQQVYPLKMKTVYDKIVHKKISICQLIQMQAKIIQALNFEMISVSFYDLAMSKLGRHLTEIGSYSQDLIKQIENICSCISKFMCYNYDLVTQFDKETLAIALANYILDFYKLERLSRPTSIQIKCKQSIIDSIVNFKRKCKGLNNLAKFTDKRVLEIVEESIL